MYAISICATFSWTQKWHKARPYCRSKLVKKNRCTFQISFLTNVFNISKSFLSKIFKGFGM